MKLTDIIDYENGDMDHDQYLAMFQEAVNTGHAWMLQGSFGREAMALIESGQIMLGEVGHRDYYGSYVPSRHEVEPGSMGSPEYVAERRQEA